MDRLAEQWPGSSEFIWHWSRRSDNRLQSILRMGEEESSHSINRGGFCLWFMEFTGVWENPFAILICSLRITTIVCRCCWVTIIMHVDIIDDLTAEGGVFRINPVGNCLHTDSRHVLCTMYSLLSTVGWRCRRSCKARDSGRVDLENAWHIPCSWESIQCRA